MATTPIPTPHPETASPARAPSRWTLAAIFGAALIGRFLAFSTYISHNPHNWLFSHPWEMGLLANTLIHGQGYSNPFGFSTGPTAFIAPGYPTLVAGIFLLFGSDTFASAIVIITMNILVSLVTIWLIMHIARQMLDTRTATVAGWVWAISLPLLFLPEIFWESSFSECAVVGIVALTLRYWREPTTAHWIILGALCGIIALINPALIFSLIAMMGWLAWQTRRVSRTAPILGLLALTLVFAPWPIRNAVRFHAFIPLRSTVGFEMWMGNRPGATGFLDESIFPMFNKQELESFRAKGEVAYTRDKSDQAWAYIRANPGIFVKLTIRRVFRFWSGTGNQSTNITYPIHALFTTVFGFLGLYFLYRNGMRAFAVLMALPLLLFPIPYYITHAEFRYRLNIDPLLTILAAYAVTQLIAALSRRNSAAIEPELIEANRA